jgi:hypothetical protein
MPAGPWVLVIGCHRSGTSAVTGALVAMGLQGVDPRDRMDDSASNPEHWESLRAALLDEDLLGVMGGSWDAPPARSVEPPVLDLAVGPDPSHVMSIAYPEIGPIAWKDPRACLLLPFWRHWLPGPLAAVFVWREPVAVARSLHVRDDIPMADGLALWENYNRAAASGLQGIDTYVLDYSSVVEDPRTALAGLAEWLRGLDQFQPWSATWDIDGAAASIDGGLRHQTAETSGRAVDLPADPEPVVDWLVASAGGNAPLTSEPGAPMSVWPEVVMATRRRQTEYRKLLEIQERESKGELDRSEEVRATLEALLRNRENQLATLRHELNGERMKYEGVRSELDRMLASTSWKLTGPLRAVIGSVDKRRGSRTG